MALSPSHVTPYHASPNKAYYTTMVLPQERRKQFSSLRSVSTKNVPLRQPTNAHQQTNKQPKTHTENFIHCCRDSRHPFAPRPKQPWQPPPALRLSRFRFCRRRPKRSAAHHRRRCRPHCRNASRRSIRARARAPETTGPTGAATPPASACAPLPPRFRRRRAHPPLPPDGIGMPPAGLCSRARRSPRERFPREPPQASGLLRPWKRPLRCSCSIPAAGRRRRWQESPE